MLFGTFYHACFPTIHPYLHRQNDITTHCTKPMYAFKHKAFPNTFMAATFASKRTTTLDRAKHTKLSFSIPYLCCILNSVYITADVYAHYQN